MPQVCSNMPSSQSNAATGQDISRVSNISSMSQECTRVFIWFYLMDNSVSLGICIGAFMLLAPGIAALITGLSGTGMLIAWNYEMFRHI